jgi:signal transduction histidine kinase
VIDDDTTFGVIVASTEGEVVRANTAFLLFLGYDARDALRGQHVQRDVLRRAADWQGWADVARGGRARDIRAEFVGADGRTVFARGRIERPRTRGTESQVMAILVDDSAAQHLRDLAVRTARIESALGLAAGVSHDFNNLLTVLVGNLYLVSEQLRDQPALHEKVRKARDAAKRGAGLARQLMAVARGADTGTDRAVLHVDRVLESLVPLLKATLGSRITLKLELAPAVPTVLANRAELESVVTNLVINARDALGARANGTVSITLCRRDVGGGGTASLKPGGYVELAVRDDGCGVPAELVPRVFEPFFSTKAPGQGSGLGLPMVRWFAEKAGGTAALASQPDQGTAVTVLLPAHHAEATDTTVRTMPLSALPSGDETVVVLSEDGDFRSTVEQILGALGYRTILGGLAGATVAPHHDAVAVVIVDAQGLGTGAAERVQTLIERHPKRVGLIVAGDSRVAWRLRAARVPKPFTLQELATAVRTAIEGG